MAINLLFGRKYPPYITRTGQPDEPYLLTLDAAIREVHEYNNEVSSFPVESGISVSDHVRPTPEKLTMEGFVTGTPVNYLGNILDQDISSLQRTGDRVITAYDVLLQIAGHQFFTPETFRSTEPSQQIIVDIFTRLRVFTDMLMTSLRIPRDRETGETLRFTAAFQRIYKAELSTAEVQNITEKKSGSGGASDQAPDEQDGGKQTTSQPPERDRSFLKILTEGPRDFEFSPEGVPSL